MSKKVYDEASVIKIISRKSSIKVNTGQKTIIIKKDATDIGNGTWGKIDYLCKVHGYSYFIKEDISKDRNIESTESKKSTESKTAKRERKLENIKTNKHKINMSSMVKNAMNKAKSINTSKH